MTSKNPDAEAAVIPSWVWPFAMVYWLGLVVVFIAPLAGLTLIGGSLLAIYLVGRSFL